MSDSTIITVFVIGMFAGIIIWEASLFFLAGFIRRFMYRRAQERGIAMELEAFRRQMEVDEKVEARVGERWKVIKAESPPTEEVVLRLTMPGGLPRCIAEELDPHKRAIVTRMSRPCGNGRKHLPFIDLSIQGVHPKAEDHGPVVDPPWIEVLPKSEDPS